MQSKTISIVVIMSVAISALWFTAGKANTQALEEQQQHIAALTARLQESEAAIARLKRIENASPIPQGSVASQQGESLGAVEAEEAGWVTSFNGQASKLSVPAFNSPEEAVAWATNAIDDEHPPHKLQALQLLIQHRPAMAVDAIQTLLTQNDKDVSDVIAGFGIIEMGASSDYLQSDHFYQFYQSKNPELRRVSAKVLLDRGDSSLAKSYMETLISSVQDGTPLEKSFVIDNIGSMGNEIAVPYILPMLSDADAMVKLRALEALTYTGSAENITDIAPLMDDAIAIVRDRAEQTINILRSNGTGPTAHLGGEHIEHGILADDIPASTVSE